MSKMCFSDCSCMHVCMYIIFTFPRWYSRAKRTHSPDGAAWARRKHAVRSGNVNHLLDVTPSNPLSYPLSSPPIPLLLFKLQYDYTLCSAPCCQASGLCGQCFSASERWREGREDVWQREEEGEVTMVMQQSCSSMWRGPRLMSAQVIQSCKTTQAT